MAGDYIKSFLLGLGFETDAASFAKFTGGVALGTAVVMGLNKVVSMAESAIKGMVNSVPELAAEYRQLAKEAEAAGVSVGDLDKMRDMAPFMESSAEAVSASLANISRAAGDTAMGIGRAKVIFEKLGIVVKDDNGKLKSSAVLMREVGEAVKGKELGQQKAILERLGIDPSMLKSLTTDMGALTAEFEALDDKIDLQGAAKASKELGKNINWIKYTTGKAREAFLAQLIGPVGKGVKYVADLAKKYFPVVIEGIKPVVDWLVRIGKAVATTASFWLEMGIKVLGFLSDVNDRTGGWAGRIALVVAAWKLLNLSFLASPIGIILELAAAIALLYDDYKTFKEGGESLIDWGKWEPWITAAQSGVETLTLTVKQLGVALGGTASILASLFTGDFKGSWEQLKYLFSGDAFKEINKQAFGAGGNALLAPAGGGTIQNVNQSTKIVVEGAGDPKAVADRVKAAQDRTNKDMTRNLKTVAQ